MASARARSSYPSPPPEEVAARCYADLARHLEPAGAQEDEGARTHMRSHIVCFATHVSGGCRKSAGMVHICAVSVVTASG